MMMGFELFVGLLVFVVLLLLLLLFEEEVLEVGEVVVVDKDATEVVDKVCEFTRLL